ncbi:MAG: glutamine amidotransferase [Wenzhouxiangellaceae bacterium]|nr:glutamine amidotransferase [Wenzhouxiangellaceae bacterium]
MIHRLLIVKTGQAVPEASADGRDFEHWFIDAMGPRRFDYTVVRVDRDEALPLPADVGAVLVTGSPAMVSDKAAWSERTAGWLAEAHRFGLPMLGVCYGHQLIAHALGGRVGPNPKGRRMGRARLLTSAEDDPLLGALPTQALFHVSHFEAVLEPPPRARVIATADHDPHHALHFGGRSWGVQFHPEFDGAITASYIRARAHVLQSEGHDPDSLLAELDPTPSGNRAGRAVLERFAQLATGR